MQAEILLCFLSGEGPSTGWYRVKNPKEKSITTAD